ncbi:uncharacterized protein PY1_contig-02-39 [Novosphingobium sp. PY1]|nr:uncharacterized protein PY1_contig-02-39 [Novosphingobium sp. PY1]
MVEQIRYFHKLSTTLSLTGSGAGPERKMVMTAFAASLFTLGAIVSLWVIAASWMRHGRKALALRAQLQACPGTLTVTWKMIERVPVPALAALRTDRKGRPAHRQAQRSALVWPGLEHAA